MGSRLLRAQKRERSTVKWRLVFEWDGSHGEAYSMYLDNPCQSYISILNNLYPASELSELG